MSSFVSDQFGEWLALRKLLQTSSFTLNTENSILSSIANALGGIQNILNIILKNPNTLTFKQLLDLKKQLLKLENKSRKKSNKKLSILSIPFQIISTKICQF